MLLPISISGATVSLLAYSFSLAGLALGMFIFTLNSFITVYTSYLLVSSQFIVDGSSEEDECTNLSWPRRQDTLPVYECGNCDNELLLANGRCSRRHRLCKKEA